MKKAILVILLIIIVAAGGWYLYSQQGTGGGESFACGTDTVDDIEGNTYNTVKIGNQCWMSENMRTTKYPDGSSITKGASADGATGWKTGQTQYSCPPNVTNDGEECSAADSLGMLYQWSAAMNGSNSEGAQGICPTGWHIPTDSELYTLENYLSEDVCTDNRTGWDECDPAGSKLAGNDAADQNWSSNTLTNHEDFDTSGFNAPAPGWRYSNGNYSLRGSYLYLWSSSEREGSSPEIDPSTAWWRRLDYKHSCVTRDSNSKDLGFSVRCVKD